jgi:uncharacterized protein (DUF1778 family)
MPAAAQRKTERLDARVTKEQKRSIARAAELRGTSLTEFVVASLQQAADEAIRNAELLELRNEDREAFVTAMLNPPAPNAAAKAAARRYRERVRQ